MKRSQPEGHQMPTMQADSNTAFSGLEVTDKGTRNIVCECGETFVSNVTLFGKTELVATRCDACVDKYVRASEGDFKDAQHSKRIDAFRERCPRGMFLFDRDRFPSDLEKHDKVVAAPCKDLGVLIHGRSGAGKSRSIWQLAQRLTVTGGRNVMILEDRAFGRLIERSFNAGNAEHDKLIREFQTCSVLIIDDIGKAKLTDRVESDLFDIIDARYANSMPMCFTTQFTGKSLQSRFSCKETGEALVRRIVESTESIYFKIKE